MKIGVLSDTHIPHRARAIPAQIRHAFKDVDLILHAGDLTSLWVLEDLERIAPTYAVRGNCDSLEVCSKLPVTRIITVEDHKIGLTHGNRGICRTTPENALSAFREEGNVDCVVFGHSHQPYNLMTFDRLLFNPGSATDPRWGPKPTYGILHIEKTIWGEIVEF